MFDYQAGEKFKLTLIMVAFAGVMAGMLFTMLMMPAAEPPKKRHHVKWAANPDVTGQPGQDGGHPYDPQGQGQSAPNVQAAMPNQASAPSQPMTMASPTEAVDLVSAWLPLTWDLSAGSAQGSQEKAIMYMTPDCAQAYRQNIWTPEIAKQIQESGLKTTFAASKVQHGQPQGDGSIVIFVEGMQTLTVPGKGSQQRPVNYEYLVKVTGDGLRIAGISEGGGGG